MSSPIGSPTRARARARWQQFGAVLVTALVLTAVVIAVLTSGSASKLRPGEPVPGAGEVARMLKGIPQQGETLGNPHAPLTLIEFGDLQCPSCAIFAIHALPEIVSRYVRTGRVKLVFKPLHFIGDDSQRAAKMAIALGQQGRLWNFAELMYRNQGAENSAYVTNTYLAALASAIRGANISQAVHQRETPNVAAEIERAGAEAGQKGVQATPSFLLGRTGGATHLLTPPNVSQASSFTQALDRALQEAGG